MKKTSLSGKSQSDSETFIKGGKLNRGCLLNFKSGRQYIKVKIKYIKFKKQNNMCSTAAPFSLSLFVGLSAIEEYPISPFEFA